MQPGEMQMKPDKQSGGDLSEVRGITELLDYQEGSIVSRQLVARNEGTVTLFAFDRGQGLSEHTAPFDALVHVLDGEAEITISGKPFRLTAGKVIMMPANKPHAVRALTRFKMMLVMIKSSAD
jgi:quercetin dioxygenase-like cupin family protein